MNQTIKIVFPKSLPGGGRSEPDPISVVPGTTFPISAGTRLVAICWETAGSDRVFSIGTTANGTDVADNEEIPAGQTMDFSRPRYFQTSATLHFSGITGVARIYLM